MRVRRVVAEKDPNYEPDAADRSKHVEGGRPAAGKTVVAEDTRQNRADNNSGIQAQKYYADNNRTVLRYRPSSNQCLHGGLHHTFAESG